MMFFCPTLGADRHRLRNLRPRLWLDAHLTPGQTGAVVPTWPDRSGNGSNAVQAAGALQPVVQRGGVNGTVLVFDGTDGMQTAAVDLTGTSAITVLAVFQNSSVAASAVLESSAAYWANVGAFLFAVNHDAAGAGTADRRVFAALSQAVGLTYRSTTPTYAVPVVVGARFDLAQAAVDEVRIRVDDVEPAQTGAEVNNAGAFGNFAMNVGARNNGASLRFTGNLMHLLLFARSLTAAEYTAADRALRNLTGIA